MSHVSSNVLSCTSQVIISTSGHTLLPNSAIHTLRSLLLPQTTVLTPNIPEAKTLLSLDSTSPSSSQNGLPDKIENVEHLVDIATAVRRLGPRWVVLKGGHLPFVKKKKSKRLIVKGVTREEDEEGEVICVDVLVGSDNASAKDEELEVEMLESGWVESKNTHGTGCSMACTLTVFIPTTMLSLHAHKIPHRSRHSSQPYQS